MANPNPSPPTRFRSGCPPGPGRPRGPSLGGKLRLAFDKEARIEGKEFGHGTTYLDIMIEVVRARACEGDHKFIVLVFELLEADDVTTELASLRALIDETSGGPARDPGVDGGAPVATEG